jgi:hypothetical protein
LGWRAPEKVYLQAHRFVYFLYDFSALGFICIDAVNSVFLLIPIQANPASYTLTFTANQPVWLYRHKEHMGSITKKLPITSHKGAGDG